MRSAHVVEQIVGRALVVGRLGQAPEIAEHLAEGHGVEREDLRLRGHRLGDGAHVVDGDRADRTQRLGHDEVGAELVQKVRIQLVERLPAVRVLPDGRVDLQRGEPRRDDGARQLGQLLGLWRIIAFVGHPDDVGAEPKSEQHLGCGRDEACNAHGR